MKRKDKNALIKITNEKLAASFHDSHLLLQKNEDGISFSKTFFEFMKPLIRDEVQNAVEDKLKSHLNWGMMVWNKAVAESYPDHKTSKTMEEAFFLATFLSKRSLVNEYLLRKHTIFETANFFIYRFETQFDNKGDLVITVAAMDLNDDSKKSDNYG